MKSIRLAIILSLLLVIAVTYVYSGFRDDSARMRSEDPRVWETTIQNFEMRDRRESPPQHAIVLIGSSSIRLWNELAEDMRPLPAFGRGFGGAKIMDLSYYVNRLLTPHQPRAVVVYIGANDFSPLMGNHAKTLQQARPLYAQLINRIENALPGVPIFIIALKPTVAGWDQWPLLQLVNRYLESLAEQDPQVYFIDANNGLLGRNGLPERDYLRLDHLHLNREGYRVWGGNIRSALELYFASRQNAQG